ncbi:MAG TPA: porin family protein [Mariprofundaceae bacterium]|nr:porin family protein [Mariprofundaceae bacterium]
MKKTMVALSLCASALAFSPAIHAQEFKPYAGAGIGAFGLEYKDATVSQKNTVFGGYGKLGADFNPYLGVELRIGTTGSGSNTYATAPTSRKLSNDYYFSYLAKLQYPATPDFNLYALVGGTTAKFKLTTPTASSSATKTGVSYGAGFDYRVDDQVSAGLEWVQYWTNVKLGTGGAFGTNAKAKIWGATATVAYHF